MSIKSLQAARLHPWSHLLCHAAAPNPLMTSKLFATQPAVIYSGADDASFKGWDVRAPARAPAFVNRRAHGAGVCIVSGHPVQQHLLVTGSYDDHIRLWDSRVLQRPLMTHEVSSRGSAAGLWPCSWAVAVQLGCGRAAGLWQGSWAGVVQGCAAAAGTACGV
jgi:WD40 repeat protein